MNQKIENLQNKIIEEFGSDITQENYKQKAERGLWESEKTMINKFFKAGSSILDVGCGTGRTTIPLKKMGYRALGIDLVPEMIESAKKIVENKKMDINYEVGDAARLRYKDNYFDNVIFSTNGFGQIPSEEKRQNAIKEIYRVLKPGGYFVLVAHVRVSGDFGWFWIKSFFKFFILKPLGFKIKEVDFGDYIFIRNVDGVDLNQNQFMHIANKKNIIGQLKKSGFNLVFAKRENEITKSDVHDQDNVYNHAPMFFVCQK